MDSESRVIGRLEEFAKSTDRRLDQIDRRLEELTKFRWRLGGAIMMISVLSTAACEMFLSMLK